MSAPESQHLQTPDVPQSSELAPQLAHDLITLAKASGLRPLRIKGKTLVPIVQGGMGIEEKLKSVAHAKKKGCNLALDCLAHCGLRDGVSSMGQFCIDRQLGHALEGDTDRGLYFRGAGKLPFGDQIRSVEELLRWLLGGFHPAHLG